MWKGAGSSYILPPLPFPHIQMDELLVRVVSDTVTRGETAGQPLHYIGQTTELRGEVTSLTLQVEAAGTPTNIPIMPFAAMAGEDVDRPKVIPNFLHQSQEFSINCGESTPAPTGKLIPEEIRG